MASLLEKLGLRQPDLKEQMKEWQKKMRAEKRGIERQIREVDREEKKLQLEIRKLAKVGGQEGSIRILAKNIVESRKATAKLYAAGANIDAVSRQMRTMSAQATMSKTFQMTGDMMKRMNKLMNAPETQAAMMDLGREMQKAGLMQEMMDDAMDMDDGIMDEDVDAEVEKVIQEATLNKLNAAPVLAEKGRMAFKESFGEQDEEADEEDPEVNDLERRLKSLS